MKIHKIVNNNVVIVLNESGQETVVMGRGIGFKKKVGYDVEKNKVEKIFTLQNPKLDIRLIKLINQIPLEYFEITNEIIKKVKNKLDTEVDEQIYISLTDHIAFAINRTKKGIYVENQMFWEIKNIYKQEFLIGLWALDMIKERIGVELPEDEAAFIAIHIINASMDNNMNNTIDITKLNKEILDIIGEEFSLKKNLSELDYARMITHLKFFAKRVFDCKQSDYTKDEIFLMLKQNYKREYSCVNRIKKFIKDKYDYEVSPKEMSYLIIHIIRVFNKAAI